MKLTRLVPGIGVEDSVVELEGDCAVLVCGVGVVALGVAVGAVTG